MNTIKTVIADDEPRARERVRHLLKEDNEIDVIAECENGAETIQVLTEKKPDLIFLDIQMPEYDGFEVIREVSENALPKIVFTTAYNQYALKAFEVHAVDYLLKPYDTERFYEAVDEVKNVSAAESNGNLDELLETLDLQEEKPDKIMVKEEGKIFFLDTDEIDWIESAGNYIKLITPERQYMIRETMTNITEKLSSHTFFRVHRSTIVNIDKVKIIEPWFHGDYQITMYNGKKLSMSRNYKEILEVF